MATNYLALRSSAVPALNAINLTLSTLTGSTITALSTLTAPVVLFSTLRGSTMTGLTLSLSTLNVSSINNNAPGTGTGSFSTLTVSSLVSVSSIQTASTMYTRSLVTTGSVGIGTAPAFPLSVQGAQSIYGTTGQNSLTTTSGNLLFYTSGDSYAYPTMNLFQYNHDNCALTFDMYLGSADWLNATTGTGFMIYKVNNSLRFYYQTGTPGTTSTNTLAMMINSSGQVGIGTASPASKLHLYQDTTNVLQLQTSSGDNAYIIANWDSVTLSSNYSSSGARTNVGRGSSQIVAYSPIAGGVITFTTSPSVNTAVQERMRITSDGSVGIGTATPTQKLEVSGTVKSTGFNLSGYNLLIPKMIYVGSQVLTGAYSGTTTASGTATFPVIIGAYGESIIEGPFSNGVNPDTSQYFKAYYVTCQITNGNSCQIGVAINNTVLASGITYSAPSFMVILQSGFFLKWTQFPTQAAYSYTNAGLNLQVYQSNTLVTNFQVNYITVHCVYLHTSYTDYTKIAGLTYNSSYQQFS